MENVFSCSVQQEAILYANFLCSSQDHIVRLSSTRYMSYPVLSSSSKREKISSSKYAGAYSEPFQIFKKECFAKIFNGFCLL